MHSVCIITFSEHGSYAKIRKVDVYNGIAGHGGNKADCQEAVAFLSTQKLLLSSALILCLSNLKKTLFIFLLFAGIAISRQAQVQLYETGTQLVRQNW